jgi:hypothetical protein
VVEVKAFEAELIIDVEEVSGVGETGATTGNDIEEDFPSEYGGSE